MMLTVLTPEKEIYKGGVTSVQLPGIEGKFEILDGHAPIVASLKKGDIRIITDDGKRSVFHIQSGFVEVLKDEVAVLIREDF